MSKSAPLPLLIGNDLNSAHGAFVTCGRTPEETLQALLAHRRDDRCDAWSIAGRFVGNHRTRENWLAAGAVLLDLDYEDPTLCKQDGAHQKIPVAARARVLEALNDYSLPGFAYATNRGMRVGHVLREDIVDAEQYKTSAEAAANRLLGHLEEHGVATWRTGRTGLRYDGASGRPSQPMRLPLLDQPTALFGANRAIDVTELAEPSMPRLELEAAFPPMWRQAVQEIAEWAQVPPELPAAEILVLVSALVGNTVVVEYENRFQNVALQVISLLESGSGKSDVRDYLCTRVRFIEDEVAAIRERAINEMTEYETALQRWKKNEAARRPDPSILRPEKPKSANHLRRCFLVSDHTAEGLGAVLANSGRGVLLAAHEAHVVLCPAKYAKAGSAKASQERALQRQWFDGQDTESVRKGELRVQRIVRPFVAASLDAQPGMEGRLFDDEDQISGTRARWLIQRLPDLAGSVRYRKVPQVSGTIAESFQDAVRALWSLPLFLDDNGHPHPARLKFSPPARDLYLTWLERSEPARGRAQGAKRAFLSHMRGRLRRIAGVLAKMRDPEASAIEAEDVERAIAWARYWVSEHDYVWSRVDSAKETECLDKLRATAQRLHAQRPDKGVSVRDLQQQFGTRYSGPVGRCRAIADLNALGWEPRKRPAPAVGRKPQPAWHPPRGPTKPTKQRPQSRSASFVDSVDARSAHAGHNGTPANELLDHASQKLLDAGDVEYPPPGRRGDCPVCGSSDGLGVLPDSPTRWYCHSDRHQAGGCAVDFWLAQRSGAMPTSAEAVMEAKSILARRA